MLVAIGDGERAFAFRADRYVANPRHGFAMGGAGHVGGDNGAAVGGLVTHDDEGRPDGTRTSCHVRCACAGWLGGDVLARIRGGGC